jgi:tetratricopeptide (TPR) repeat protein
MVKNFLSCIRISRTINSLILSTYVLNLLSCALPTETKSKNFVPSSELKVIKYVNQGVSEFSRSRFTAAEGSFYRALNLSPDNKIIKNNLAITLLRLGAVEQAESLLRELLSEESNSIELLLKLSSVAIAQDSPIKALSFLEVAQSKLLLKPNTAREVLAGNLTNSEKSIQNNTIKMETILSALSDVSCRAGLESTCYCYLSSTSSITKSVQDYVAYIRFLLMQGNFDHALNVLKTLPATVRERTMSIYHLQALAYLGLNDFNSFKEYEQKALVSYDTDEETEKEIKALNSFLDLYPEDFVLSIKEFPQSTQSIDQFVSSHSTEEIEDLELIKLPYSVSSNFPPSLRYFIKRLLERGVS